MSNPSPYPSVVVGQPHVFLGKEAERLEAYLHDLHPQPFADTVNTEIARLDGYYRSCADWLNNGNLAHIIAAQIQIPQGAYDMIAKENHYLSNRILDVLVQKALQLDHSAADIRSWASSEHKPVNLKNIARQRMLMMGSVLHSEPIIMRDPFAGATATSSYGFIDGKAKFGNVSFSAVASPRIHGQVFRFAVCQINNNGYVDNNPAMILSDNACDWLEKWEKSDDLLSAMSINLYPNIHDWIHSWLLYDTRAKSDSFQQWGADIFFNVNHLIQNKLVINYELLSMSLHRYVWKTMMDADPNLSNQLHSNLENYIKQVKEFGSWVASQTDATHGKHLEDYLIYVVLSNLCFVLDPKEPQLANILATYPAVKDKLEATLGSTLSLLHSDIGGIPSQAAGGNLENMIGYINRYPMADEVSAGLKAKRLKGKTGEKTITPSGAIIYTENMKEFESLPDVIRAQVVNIKDSDTYGILNKALDKLPEHHRQHIIDRIELDDDGRMFFRIDRTEIDLNKTSKVLQDKKVVLVKVPKDCSVNLLTRVTVNLLDVVKRQQTTATDIDVIAFNVTDENAAQQILQEPDIAGMIAKAKQLASAIDGADDIYPLRRQKAVQIFNFNGTGFYQSLNRERYAAKAAGPMIMRLQDGSDQKLLDGVAVYIPFENDTENPDIHFIETRDFKRTHKLNFGMQAVSKLDMINQPEFLQGFLAELGRINRIIDFGENHQLAKGLFT